MRIPSTSINTSAIRIVILSLLLSLGACNTAPPMPEQPVPLNSDEIEEPVFSAVRVLPVDISDYDPTYDPWEGMNRRFYNFNYHFDRYVFLPVVGAWTTVMPKFVRVGVHNFFENFRDVRTLINSVLQLSGRKAVDSTGRVLVNSTIGLAGFIDVATKINITHHDEDFGQTLGYWGVGPGPYIVLPIIGPSNLRDGTTQLVDYAIVFNSQAKVLPKGLRDTIFIFDSLDTRSYLPFRYYETGSAFEYETLRWMYGVKRELDIAK